MLKRCIKSNEYFLMYKDEEIGIVGYKDGNYYVEITNFDLFWTKYPPIWDEYPVTNTHNQCDTKSVKEFIEEKVVPECRAQRILDIIGLDHYNPWEIIKYTKGATTDDYWWFAAENDEYEKCHPRAAWDRGETFNDMFTIAVEVKPVLDLKKETKL